MDQFLLPLTLTLALSVTLPHTPAPIGSDTGATPTVKQPSAPAVEIPVLAGADLQNALAELKHKALYYPIVGADPENIKGSFNETHFGSMHRASDILAPRNTPIHAVDDGTIAKLFLSQAGGITIYQFDPSHKYVYYYAHLERYADGLADGQHVMKGQVIGYVGTSGNAPPNTPHLHFAIGKLTQSNNWWQTQPIDPYLVFTKLNSAGTVAPVHSALPKGTQVFGI